MFTESRGKVQTHMCVLIELMERKSVSQLYKTQHLFARSNMKLKMKNHCVCDAL